jgi:hypothetical protein
MLGGAGDGAAQGGQALPFQRFDGGGEFGNDPGQIGAGVGDH